MARVTVEDCEKVVPNRFDLVILAAQRARQMAAGEPATIDVDGEKKPVTALREIAARTVLTEDLKDRVVWGFRTVVPEEERDDGIDEVLEEDTYNPYINIENKLESKPSGSVEKRLDEDSVSDADL